MRIRRCMSGTTHVNSSTPGRFRRDTPTARIGWPSCIRSSSLASDRCFMPPEPAQGRSDSEFEAFLLEFLSDYTVSIPEIGTVSPDGAPIVVLTSNRTREIHAALNRRCLYHWLDLPDVERETEIILLHVPEAPETLARSVARAVARVRQMDLVRRPGAAEAIDWCRALALLGATALEDSPDLARQSLGWVAKNRDDVQRLNRQLAELLESVKVAEQGEEPMYTDTPHGEHRG